MPCSATRTGTSSTSSACALMSAGPALDVDFFRGTGDVAFVCIETSCAEAICFLPQGFPRLLGSLLSPWLGHILVNAVNLWRRRASRSGDSGRLPWVGRNKVKRWRSIRRTCSSNGRWRHSRSLGLRQQIGWRLHHVRRKSVLLGILRKHGRRGSAPLRVLSARRCFALEIPASGFLAYPVSPCLPGRRFGGRLRHFDARFSSPPRRRDAACHTGASPRFTKVHSVKKTGAATFGPLFVHKNRTLDY